MNENTHQNFCEYADDLVSYLYDEIETDEKSRFKLHLTNCAACAEELADFAVARSSISEWRETEFQPLTTPIIQFPKANRLKLATESSIPTSLSARIRAFFALSPAWIGAAAAALVICAGLWFVKTNLQRTENVARNENETNAQITASPANESVAELKTVNSEKSEETFSEKSSKPLIIDSKEFKPANENVAVRVTQSETASPKKIKAEKNIRPNKPFLKKSNQSPPPTLLADDEDSEDDSPRLSDLFKEVGS